MPEKERTPENLPDMVKEKLPEHAQHIYQEAHDSAIDRYRDPSQRRGDASLEETAHKVAWAAVEQKYEKNDRGEWVEKKE